MKLFFQFQQLFFFVRFFHYLYTFIKIKIKSCEKGKKNLSYYLEKYPLVESVKEIKKTQEKYKSNCSDNTLNIAFLLGRIFLGVLFILYFEQIGEKLDNPKNGGSWITLFIPIYILLIPVIGFMILHIVSLYTIFKKKYWLVIITFIPCAFALITNSILLPLSLEKKFQAIYLIPLFFFIGTLFLGIHLKVVSIKLDDF